MVRSFIHFHFKIRSDDWISWGFSISNNNAMYLESQPWKFTFVYITNNKDNYANYNYATECMTINISKS